MQVTLGDVGEIISGGTPSTAIPEYWNGEINWITPADLSGYSKKYIIHGAKSISKLGLKKSSAKLMPKGSVLFSSRAPIGYVVIANSELCTNQGFKSIIPNESVFNEYLFYFLKSAKKEVQDAASGTTFKEISLTKFSKLRIPLPPLAEQHRIVAKIEELFSSLDKGTESLKTAQQQLKVYRQSVLKAAFSGKLTEKFRKTSDNEKGTCLPAGRLEGKLTNRTLRQAQGTAIPVAQGAIIPVTEGAVMPVTQGAVMPVAEPVEATNKDSELPEGWEFLKLGDVSETCLGKMLDKNKNKGELHKYLANRNVRWGTFDLSELKSMRFEKNEKERYGLKRDDLIVCEGGEPGRCAIWSSNDSIYIQKALHRVRMHSGYNTKYIFYFILFSALNGNLERYFTGTTIKHLTGKALKKVEFPVPPFLNEQNAIVAAIESRLSVCDKIEESIEESLKQAEALRQSILKKAFEGKLVAQDPNDLPASTLLARIKAEREKQKVSMKGVSKKI